MLQRSKSCIPVNFPADIYQLDRGLTLIHQYLPTTPVVVADVWVKAGSIAEPSSWSGMAHFLEHMIFKGSSRLGVGQFDRLIEYTGSMTNAATSYDYAHFFLTAAVEHLPDTLPLLADLLLQAAIPDEEFVRERDVVLEEIHSCYDDPDWIGFQALCQSIYQYHPYGRSILGEEELILKHTPNQMRCFHRTYYQPENMTVAIVGGIEAAAALSIVEESFSNFNPRSECPSFTVEAEPPLIDIRRQELTFPRLSGARLSMGWIGAGIDHLEDALGLDLLSAILASSRSSRLVKELREEKQLVFEINSCFSLQKDSSLFTISAYLETQHINEVEKIIRQCLFTLQNSLIDAKELARFQCLLNNDYIFSTETPGQLAGLYGYYQTIAKAELSVNYPHYIKQLKAVDLQRIASQYLSPERYAITILLP